MRKVAKADQKQKRVLDIRRIICLGIVLAITLMMSACGSGGQSSGGVQPAENGRQVLIDTADISVAAVDYKNDDLNRKTVQFEVANHTDKALSFWVTGIALDGKNIKYNYSIDSVEGNTESDVYLKLFSVDLYDYDKNLFPNLKSFEISVAVKDAEGNEIASVKQVSLDFHNLGAAK